MAVFKDPTGRRGRVVKLGFTIGAAALAATAGVFVLSLFPAAPDKPAAAKASSPHAVNPAEQPARAGARGPRDARGAPRVRAQARRAVPRAQLGRRQPRLRVARAARRAEVR